YIHQRNWPAVEEATRRAMGEFIISPSDKGGKLSDPPSNLVAPSEPLSPIAPSELSCGSRAAAHTSGIGASRPTDFYEPLGTLPLRERARAELEPIVARLQAAMLEATGDRHPEDFLPGMPPYQSLPNNYILATILWLLNLAKGWDMQRYAKWRFGLLDNAGHWFAGNRPRTVEDVDDVALLEALGDYPRKDAVPALLRQAVERFGSADVKRLSQG